MLLLPEQREAADATRPTSRRLPVGLEAFEVAKGFSGYNKLSHETRRRRLAGTMCQRVGFS